MEKQVLFRADGDETVSVNEEINNQYGANTPVVELPEGGTLQAYALGRAVAEPMLARPVLKVWKWRFSVQEVMMVVSTLCMVALTVKSLKR